MSRRLSAHEEPARTCERPSEPTRSGRRTGGTTTSRAWIDAITRLSENRHVRGPLSANRDRARRRDAPHDRLLLSRTGGRRGGAVPRSRRRGSLFRAGTATARDDSGTTSRTPLRRELGTLLDHQYPSSDCVAPSATRHRGGHVGADLRQRAQCGTTSAQADPCERPWIVRRRSRERRDDRAITSSGRRGTAARSRAAPRPSVARRARSRAEAGEAKIAHTRPHQDRDPTAQRGRRVGLADP